MNYKIKVNDTYEFSINKEKIQQLDLISTAPCHYHLIHNNQSVKAEITQSDFNSKSYEITISNTTYRVTIADALDQMITQMGFETNSSKKANVVKAPMPGLILDVLAKAGQEVNENDNLLILEAMKMENIITSPRQGIIKAINVAKADAVEKNQLLIEFE